MIKLLSVHKEREDELNKQLEDTEDEEEKKKIQDELNQEKEKHNEEVIKLNEYITSLKKH